MGYPVVQALYGDSAIFYITIFNMPFSILFFSMGLHLLKKDAAIASGNFVKEKLNLRSFINNGIIASVAGTAVRTVPRTRLSENEKKRLVVHITKK